MTLDLVVSQRLREPTPWELEQWRAAPKHDRADWEDVLDRASLYRWDDSVLRKVDEEARREECQRKLWFMPAPAMCGGPRPNVFRCLFRKDIGGVAGVSESWFDAAFTVESGGKVTDFIDYVDTTHALNQSNGSLQVAAPTADAALSNAFSATFVPASVTRYVSTRLSSSFRFWQNGTGVHIYLTWVPVGATTTYLVSTRAGGGAAENGGTILRLSTGAVNASWTNGTTQMTNPSGGNAVAGTGTFCSFSYSETESPEYNLKLKTTSLGSGSSLVAPIAADPQGTLTLGSGTTGTAPANMRFRSLHVFRRVLTSAADLIVRQRIQYETGLS
jgi:hypothetical protein